MAYFSVIMYGQGIAVESFDSGEDVIGFYTTRWVKAASKEEAQHVAVALVMSEWKVGKYADVNSGNPPQISVDQTTQVGLFTYLRRRPGTATFSTAQSEKQ